ncbi:MAG: hypothetical protein GH155_06340 [Spirochaeta sp.]|nr:hypothetical protein [Spirochaeta sp.]
MYVKKIFIILILIFGVAVAFACQLTFSLISGDGSVRNIVPGRRVDLELSESYTLKVTFEEDHGNCPLPAEETVFLLEEEKWKASKDYLPLILQENISWSDTGSRSHVTELAFTAAQAGVWKLEIIRDCDKKEGYDENLIFSIR